MITITEQDQRLIDFTFPDQTIPEDIQKKNLPALMDLLRFWEPRFETYTDLQLFKHVIGADGILQGADETAEEIYNRSGSGNQESKMMRQFCIRRIVRLSEEFARPPKK